MTRLLVLASCLAILAIAASACAPVRPWERGRLLNRRMSAVLCPLESSRDGHVYATREAMEGASVAGGAACGCN